MKRWTCVILALCMALTMCACGKTESSAQSWQEQYDLGVKYLDDGNYDEAVVTFTAAIKIDPKRAEAYSGLANAYIGKGDKDSAKAALQKGYEATGDEKLKKRIDEFDVTADKANVTYTSPFSLADLEAWKYPWGEDIYTLQSNGDIYDVEGRESVAEWIDWYTKTPDNSLSSGSLLRDKDPKISVYHYNFKIMQVNINQGDSVTGPRGIALGMSIADVIKLFRCDEKKALEFSKTLSPDLLDETKYNDGTSLRVLNLYTITPASGSAQDSWRGIFNANLFISGGKTYITYSVQGYADFTVNFDGGKVSSMSVYYRYD